MPAATIIAVQTVQRHMAIIDCRFIMAGQYDGMATKARGNCTEVRRRVSSQGGHQPGSPIGWVYVDGSRCFPQRHGR